jgi:hypothetical protein
MTGVTNRYAGTPQRMPRYLQALDPRRSLATAVAWFAVVLSLAIALALLTVGDFALNSMLAQRDARMMRFATQLAASLEHAVAEQAPRPQCRRRSSSPSSSMRCASRPSRIRAPACLLLDQRHDILFERPTDTGDVPSRCPAARCS